VFLQHPFDPEKFAGMLGGIIGADNVRLQEPMRNHTSFRIGGPADIFAAPADAASVCAVIRLCRAEGVPYFIMGNGSNLLVRDGGIRGAVINLSERFNHYRIIGDTIEAEAGALNSKIAAAASKACLGGMEIAAGIPGTIGGAVMMNAGAYDWEMKDIVLKTAYLDTEDEIRTLEADAHGFGYRTSVFQTNGGIILTTLLKLVPCEDCVIRAKTEEFRQKRRDRQPLEFPSAGSVFKRPEGYFAGQMIEKCGLKGLQMGGAQISPKHAGFIVNTGDASAEDVIRLIEYAIEAVYNDFGIRLETEIRITGTEADK
jgi:UDP-N-acetylmuramate dehydrogenase